MPKFNDLLFKKIFMALVMLALMLVFIIGIHLFYRVPLNSKSLWLGTIMVYLSFNLLHGIRGIGKKIIVLGASSIAMAIYLNNVLHWNLQISFLTGAAILIGGILFFISFLH